MAQTRYRRYDGLQSNPVIKSWKMVYFIAETERRWSAIAIVHATVFADEAGNLITFTCYALPLWMVIILCGIIQPR